jgi:hypothetical protein
MTYSITRLGAYDALKARLSHDGTSPVLGLSGADGRDEKVVYWRDGAMCKWSRSSRRSSRESSRYVLLSKSLTSNTLMADIILVRMVADPTKAVEKQHGYRNALHGVYKMVQQEGPSSLARGLLPNTVRPPVPLR